MGRATAWILLPAVLMTPPLAAQTLDETAPPGTHHAAAEFRLWLPGPEPVRGVVVMVPGSNGDGRDLVQLPAWQDFARHHGLALLGTRFTDPPHDQPFIELYVDVAHGPGQALLDALDRFALRASHPELASAPLLLWGFSAGGQFNYEFAAWRPDRVAAFVVNKGGIYYSALVPRAAREVPGLFITGETDLAFRSRTIEGLFAVNRRAGALWTFVAEPATGHVIGRSEELARRFFAEILPLRLPPGATALRPIPAGSGFLGDLETFRWQPVTGGPAPTRPTAWLATEGMARVWEAVATGR